MFFALLHELGHLIVGRICGFKLESLLIFPFGFTIKFKKITFKAKKCGINKKMELKKMLTAFSGPVMNVLVIIFIKIFYVNGDLKNILIFFNMLIAIFNMLPIYPLDGGRIVYYFFNIFFDVKKSYTYIQNISYIAMFFLTFFVSILMYYLKNILLFFAIIYLWRIVIKEDKVAKMKIKMEKHIQFPETML